MTETAKQFLLKSSDGEDFELDEAVAFESEMMKRLFGDSCEGQVMTLPVTGAILSKVIEYCKKQVEHRNRPSSSANDEELQNWDAKFLDVDQSTLFDLILASNYLNIKSLLDLTCQRIADMIKGKSPQEIARTFNSITNEFTPEEEEEVRRENQWAFE